MLGEINRRTRINFPLIPYILKSEFHETFIPSTFSRHVTTFTDRLCYSHSDRIRFASNLSLPPPPRHQRISSVTEKGDSIGSHRHPRLLPSDPLCSTICLQCVRSSSFSRVSLSFSPQFFFVLLVRSAHAASRKPSIDSSAFSFLAVKLPRLKKKRNSIRLATFPLILFLVLEDGYGYQCTDTLMEDRRFSSRSKINFFSRVSSFEFEVKVRFFFSFFFF